MHALPTLLVETHFPLGLFRAWTVWRPAATALVYPAPQQPAPPLPAGEPTSHGERPVRVGSGGEFDGVRTYRRGDPASRVVWKKVAHSGELVSRDTSASAAQALQLDLATAGGGGTGVNALEDRLSRLVAWVLAADNQGLGYALRLPGVDLPAAAGPAQRRDALQALALCGQVPVAGISNSDNNGDSGNSR